MTQQVSHQHLDMTGGLNLSPQTHIWGFPKMEVPKNRWFIKDNPTKMEDLGVPLFWETSIFLHALEQTILCFKVRGIWNQPAGIVSKIHDPTSQDRNRHQENREMTRHWNPTNWAVVKSLCCCIVLVGHWGFPEWLMLFLDLFKR